MRAPLALALLLAWPAPAAASSAVLLPRAGGSGVGAAARDEAMAAVEQVLENEGWQVYRLDEVSIEVPARLSSCGPDDRCGWELAQLLSVDVAIGVRVWGEEERVERVSVAVIGRRGVGHRAIAEVSADVPLPFAAADASRGALRVWALAADGFRPPPEPSEPPPIDDARLEPSAINWALGALLLLGSVPTLGYGINTAAHDGECSSEGPRGGIERVRFQEGAGIFTGVGAALLVAGVVVLITQPIRLTVQADRASAALSLTGVF